MVIWMNFISDLNLCSEKGKHWAINASNVGIRQNHHRNSGVEFDNTYFWEMAQCSRVINHMPIYGSNLPKVVS